MAKVTLDELFEELRAKNEAEWHDPKAVARREAMAAEHRARIDAEITAGIRDEDGELDPTSEAARALYDFGNEDEPDDDEDEPEEF